MKYRQILISGVLLATAPFFAGNVALAEETTRSMVYDDIAYTEYVEATMVKLDRLYLDFCAACNVDASKAGAAKREFLATVRDLMQHMNGRFDSLDPKAGAALSPTETLVSIHALTMLVDILTAIQLEEMAAHPYIE
jgi:hypothetical protein